MSEIKDINKLVIKNSATIELERRKGFVNILLQGNPNLYRAWVERNNKIVIDISGESTEYNLETQTPDYIEILKNQENDKYYINFIGSIETEQFISDDMTFEDTPNGVRISIKDSKYVATDMISSGTPDYVFVNVDESGRVSIGINQEVVNMLRNSFVYLNLSINTSDFLGYITIPDYNSYGFKSGSFDGGNITVENAVQAFQSGSLLKIKLNDAGIEREYITRVYLDHFTSDSRFRMQFEIPVNYGYALVDKTQTVLFHNSFIRNALLKVCIYSDVVGMTTTREICWSISSNSDICFELQHEDDIYILDFSSLFWGEVEFKNLYHLYNIVRLMGNLYYWDGTGNYLPCFLYVNQNDKLYLTCVDGDTLVNKEILYDSTDKYYYITSSI